MNAAFEAGVLEPAIDAAASVRAANSLEDALPWSVLDVLPLQRQPQPGEVARLANAAARQVEIYETGRLTLQKLKTGGRQQVVVQHQQVNVGPGGQAVVAGRLARGSRTGARRKKGR